MIQRDDTVRYTGRRSHWIVDEVHGDTADVTYVRRSRQGMDIIQRTVRLDRIELIRKGNKDQDAIDELDRLLGQR